MGTYKALTKAEKKFILKVASLIEDGSAGMIQTTGNYISRDGLKCCAMGACFKAVGMVEIHNVVGFIVAGNSFELRDKLGLNSWPRIPFPKSELEPYAMDDLGRAFLIDVVIFLNDRLGWSFQRIVAYLRDATLPQPKVIGIKG